MKLIFGYLAGLLFGLGLAIAGMTDPHRVQGFLDVFGNWDPTLIFVLGGRGDNVYRLPIGVPSSEPSVRRKVYAAHTS